MKRIVPVLSFALLAACAVPATAQDGTPPGPRVRDRGPGRAARPEPREADPAVEAWVRVLAGRLADPNPVVRRSAAEGIAATGRAALPVLGKMAGSEDAAVAGAAMRLIARIEVAGHRGRRGPAEGNRRGRMDGPGRGPGFRGPAGRGPGGPGGEGMRGPGLRGRGPEFRGPDGRGPGRRGPGEAGPGRGDGPGGGPGLEALGLTEEQKERLEALRESHREKMEALRERVRDGSLDPAAVEGARGKMREEMRIALEEILTPEQRARMERLREERGPRGPGFRPGGPPPGRPPR